MKQVYKCDYCTHTGHRNEVLGHEAGCSFNPANKKCYTCQYFISQGMKEFAYDECIVNNPDLLGVLDGDIKCDLWEKDGNS